MAERSLSGVLVICVLFLCPFGLTVHGADPSAQERGQAESFQKIRMERGLLSLDVKDAELSAVLKEIGEKAGIKISIGKDLVGRKITLHFENLDLESAFRRILGTNYAIVLLKGDRDKKTVALREVFAVGQMSPEAQSERMIAIEIPYGSGKEAVGVVRDPLVGPKSFAVDPQGKIYVLDNVNERIQIFSPQGGFLSTIPLPKGQTAEDLALDRFGNVYVYFNGGRLSQFDGKGTDIARVEVDEARWKVQRSMKILDDQIFVNACDLETCADYLVGRIIRGVLSALSDEEKGVPPVSGRRGSSGRRYETDLRRSERGELKVTDSEGTVIQRISIALEGIIGIEFLGEDERGNIFVKTDQTENRQLQVSVHKFNRDGDYLATFRMPKSRVLFWSVRNFAVSKDGTIYRFLPEADELRFNIFPGEIH